MIHQNKKHFVLSTALIALALLTTACHNSADKQAGSTLEVGSPEGTTPQGQESKRVEIAETGISFDIPTKWEVIESRPEADPPPDDTLFYDIQREGEEYDNNIIHLSITPKNRAHQSVIEDENWDVVEVGNRTIGSRIWRYTRTQENRKPNIVFVDYETTIGDSAIAFDHMFSEGDLVYSALSDALQKILISFTDEEVR